MREIRLDRGLTLEQLADLAGISKGYLSQIETGRKTVNARRIEALARALRVHPSEIFADETISKETKELLEVIEKLDQRDRETLAAFAATLRRQSEERARSAEPAGPEQE